MYRISLIILLAFFSKFCHSVPVYKLENDIDIVPDVDQDTEIAVINNFTDVDGNNSSADLFVIKTVVYEIGILTDLKNDTNYDNETHEQIDVAFFDPDNNGTFIDLSNIPIPIQTNVSGVSITGIVSANFGGLNLLSNGTPTINDSFFPIFPNKQVKVSHNISTYNKDMSNSILEGLPEILGLKDILNYKNDSSDDENKSKQKSNWEKKLEGVDTDEIE